MKSSFTLRVMRLQALHFSVGQYWTCLEFEVCPSSLWSMFKALWDLCLYEAAVMELKWSWFNLVGTNLTPSNWLWAPPPFPKSYMGIYHLWWWFYAVLAEFQQWHNPWTSNLFDPYCHKNIMDIQWNKLKHWFLSNPFLQLVDSNIYIIYYLTIPGLQESFILSDNLLTVLLKFQTSNWHFKIACFVWPAVLKQRYSVHNVSNNKRSGIMFYKKMSMDILYRGTLSMELRNWLKAKFHEITQNITKHTIHIIYIKQIQIKAFLEHAGFVLTSLALVTNLLAKLAS